MTETEGSWVDLSHSLGDGFPAFPGDPPIRLECVSRLPGDPYTAHRLTTGLHVGTHLDAPLHMVEGGGSLADVPLERLMGRGVAVDARGAHEVGEELLRAVDLEAGDMVVVVTGFSAIFDEPRYFTAYPDVTEAFARRLLEAGVRMLCLDSPSPDRSPFPVHRLLLGSGVLIAENLRGAERLLEGRAFDLFAFPIRLEADGAPARIAARVRR